MRYNKSDLETIKHKLIALRQQLMGSITEAKEEVKDSDDSKGYSQHQADEGTDDFGRTINIEVTNTEQSILKHIDRALEKIDEGTYGICDISEKEIPKARLDAIPYATMTVDSQEKFEKGLI
jgi:DnaK suppressor protein